MAVKYRMNYIRVVILLYNSLWDPLGKSGKGCALRKELPFFSLLFFFFFLYAVVNFKLVIIFSCNFLGDLALDKKLVPKFSLPLVELCFYGSFSTGLL